MRYAVVIEKTDNGYSAYAPDLPGCIAAGDPRAETERLIREAICDACPVAQGTATSDPRSLYFYGVNSSVTNSPVSERGV